MTSAQTQQQPALSQRFAEQFNACTAMNEAMYAPCGHGGALTVEILEGCTPAAWAVCSYLPVHTRADRPLIETAVPACVDENV